MHGVRSFAPWLILLTATVGCGDGPFRVVAVSGTVAYEDGEPLPAEGFYVKFVPQVESPDGKTFPRIATAKVDAAGEYDGVTTFKYNDGLIVGEHLAYLEFGTPSAGRKVAPEEYLKSKTTPLRIEISSSESIDIRIPRP